MKILQTKNEMCFRICCDGSSPLLDRNRLVNHDMYPHLTLSDAGVWRLNRPTTAIWEKFPNNPVKKLRAYLSLLIPYSPGGVSAEQQANSLDSQLLRSPCLKVTLPSSAAASSSSTSPISSSGVTWSWSCTRISLGFPSSRRR